VRNTQAKKSPIGDAGKKGKPFFLCPVLFLPFRMPPMTSRSCPFLSHCISPFLSVKFHMLFLSVSGLLLRWWGLQHARVFLLSATFTPTPFPVSCFSIPFPLQMPPCIVASTGLLATSLCSPALCMLLCSFCYTGELLDGPVNNDEN
jgi:hypothetical protein